MTKIHEHLPVALGCFALSLAAGFAGASCGASGNRPAPPTSEGPPVGYPMCLGQRIANASGKPRSGPVDVQLAPSFLDEMAACRSEDLAIQDTVARARDGKINAKGDCEYPDVGVSCHYHAGAEFVTLATTKQVYGQGELHCIFPGSDPKSPRVYGGHVVCRNRLDGELRGQKASHDVHAGASCSAALLRPMIDQCMSFRCCDDGTLTAPIADLQRDGRNDLRPDFRICSDAMEVDCGLLADLTPHEANSPALGGVGEAVFGVSRDPQRKGFAER